MRPSADFGEARGRRGRAQHSLTKTARRRTRSSFSVTREHREHYGVAVFLPLRGVGPGSAWIWTSCVSIAGLSGPWVPIRLLAQPQVRRLCRHLTFFKKALGRTGQPSISQRIARELFTLLLHNSMKCWSSGKPPPSCWAFPWLNVHRGLYQAGGSRRLENQHLIKAFKVIMGS